jgi:hypothetical protein
MRSQRSAFLTTVRFAGVTSIGLASFLVNLLFIAPDLALA